MVGSNSESSTADAAAPSRGLPNRSLAPLFVASTAQLWKSPCGLVSKERMLEYIIWSLTNIYIYIWSLTNYSCVFLADTRKNKRCKFMLTQLRFKTGIMYDFNFILYLKQISRSLTCHRVYTLHMDMELYGSYLHTRQRQNKHYI